MKKEVNFLRNICTMEDLASLGGFRVNKLLPSYLGLPLEPHFKPSLAWEVIEKRFHKRLALWKERGGSRILLKSTLSKISIYFFFF